MMELDLEHAKVDKWQVKVEDSPWSWQLTRSTWNQLPNRRGGTPWMAVDPFAVLVALEWWRLAPRKCWPRYRAAKVEFALSTMRAALCEPSPRRKCIWNWRWCTGGFLTFITLHDITNYVIGRIHAVLYRIWSPKLGLPAGVSKALAFGGQHHFILDFINQ